MVLQACKVRASPGKQVGLWVDVQGSQALHRLQHVDGVRHSRLEESNVSVDATGRRSQGQCRSPRRTRDERRWREHPPHTDDVPIRLLLQMSFDHPGSVLPVGHHPAEGQHTEKAAQCEKGLNVMEAVDHNTVNKLLC